MHNALIVIAVAFSAVLAAGNIAVGQTAASLLSRPWTTATNFEVTGGALGQTEGESEGPGFDLRLSQYNASARWRYDKTTMETVAAGLRFQQLRIHTDDPVFPDTLTDMSVAATVGHVYNDRWKIGVTGGAGYAGDHEFSNGNAWYALGRITAVHTMDAEQQLVFALDYNGNRTIFPDVPLPGFFYRYQPDANFAVTLGVPRSAVDWRPAEKWRIKVGWSLPYYLDAMVDFEVVENWHLFAQIDRQQQAYAVEGMDDNERLLFSQWRAEGGVRVEVGDLGHFIAAGGYAFDQEFERGWDVRDTDEVREISDEPYLRLAFTVGF